MVRAIDWFNEHLRDTKAAMTLDDSNLDLY
jgi:hypothetical protein